MSARISFRQGPEILPEHSHNNRFYTSVNDEGSADCSNAPRSDAVGSSSQGLQVIRGEDHDWADRD
jgi:hypothetical protein